MGFSLREPLATGDGRGVNSLQRTNRVMAGASTKGFFGAYCSFFVLCSPLSTRVLVGGARGSPWVFLLVGALRSPVDDATGAGVRGIPTPGFFLFCRCSVLAS